MDVQNEGPTTPRKYTKACNDCAGACIGVDGNEDGSVSLVITDEQGIGIVAPLTGSRQEWEEFRDGIKAGKFDHI